VVRQLKGFTFWFLSRWNFVLFSLLRFVRFHGCGCWKRWENALESLFWVKTSSNRCIWSRHRTQMRTPHYPAYSRTQTSNF
jgi:hypothetical protein